MNTYYVTEDRLKELKAELMRLKGEARREIADRLQRAKELGDLAENADYIEAREEQGFLETRITELEDMIQRASVIKKDARQNSIQVGSTFHVKTGDCTMTFTIVGPSETRPEEGFISNESPIGKAFLGKKVGDTALVKTPKGETAYEIVSME